MKRVPLGGHVRGGPRRFRTHAGRGRAWWRATAMATAVAAVSLVLPSGIGNAAPGRPMPSLSSLVARARALAAEINTLNQQYDGLSIQLSQARTEAKLARRTYQQDMVRLGKGRLSLGQLAAENYMTGGQDSVFALLLSSTPQQILSSAAIMQHLQQENGDRVRQLKEALTAAERARQTARQQSTRAKHLVAQMSAKKRQAQSKINTLNSAVFAKAMAVFDQTGNYPNINIPTANTIGAQALRYALEKRGDPYVWGAAGPNAFDCSGLVKWAYAMVGISLPHYTGAQWNMGIHVTRSELQPGDLVFFYANISHVGLYIGNGLMLDAPDFGQVVQVQPIWWGAYVGAVRIVG